MPPAADRAHGSTARGDATEPATLDHAALPDLLRRIHDRLRRHREEVDRLNVFPVPDGDTGTNMTLTARSALAVLEQAPPGDPHERCAAVARAAMRGARGNSGVILSQVIRGLVEALAGDRLDAAGYAAALGRARRLAYDAVADPVEGTILTAIRVAAETADAHAPAGLVEASAAVRDAVHGAVQRTREQLDVNRAAGVVDAGARGLELVLDAVHAHLTGGPVDSGEEVPLPPADCPPAATTGHAVTENRYEVQYLLDVDRAGPDATQDVVAHRLRDRLAGLGDSVAVVAVGDLVSVHVHTDDIGAAIEAGIRSGRPSRIEVRDLAAQVDQVAGSGDVSARDGGVGEETRGPRPSAPLGCVAVLPAGALVDVVAAGGIEVVQGAAGALPSVDDLLHAVGATHARHVILLPGHRNVVPTADQCRLLAPDDVAITVVPGADSPVAVLAAAAVWHPDHDPAVTTDDVEAAAEAVTTVEVVAAVRDADTPIGGVRRGQHLAVVDGRVVGAHDDPVAAVLAGVRRAVRDHHELATVVSGAEAPDDELEQVVAAVAAAADHLEVHALDGGFRPSRYVIGLE